MNIGRCYQRHEVQGQKRHYRNLLKMHIFNRRWWCTFHLNNDARLRLATLVFAFQVSLVCIPVTKWLYASKLHYRLVFVKRIFGYFYESRTTMPRFPTLQYFVSWIFIISIQRPLITASTIGKHNVLCCWNFDAEMYSVENKAI